MRLVTGGAGFVGSHVVDMLLSQGPVRVLDDLSTGNKSFLDAASKRRGYAFQKGDAFNASHLAKALRDVDEVWHLAADPDARAAAVRPRKQFRHGAGMTLSVLEAMRRSDARRIIFSSSSVVYGEPSKMPTPEDYGPCLPISTYGAAKVAAEGLIASYVGTYGFQAWVFRFGNVVGPRLTHGVLYDFKAKLQRDPTRLEILGNGKQEKSYLSTEDCVEGMWHGVQNSHAPVNVFNLASEEATDVTRIAHVLIDAMGLKGVRLDYTGGERGWPGDVRRMRLDIARMKALGWKPRHSSLDAVQRAAAWVARAKVK